MNGTSHLKQDIFFCFAILFLLACQPLYASEQAEQISSGQLNWVASNGNPTPAIHLGSHVEANVSGLLGMVTLTQLFTNQSDQWQEAIYTFPLPDSAVVSGMRIKVGEKNIVASVKEKKQAKALYQQAKKEGKVASLVQQHRPNLFSQRLANIPPHETVRIELQFELPVRYRHNRFELRLPTTITPRYMPGAPITAGEAETVTLSNNGWASATDVVPDATEISPYYLPQEAQSGRNRMSVNITVDSGVPVEHVTSPSHAIRVSTLGETRYGIATQHASEPMDRDIILHWYPSKHTVPVAAAFVEQVASQYYALVMLQPPVTPTASPMPQERVFIIDRSGSMAGTSMRQAKQALQLALAQLTPNDSFNIIAFDDESEQLFTHSAVANRQNIALAREFVEALEADGGTDMQPALQLALQEQSNKLRQIVFITDGSVGNEQQLLAQIHQQLGNNRLFTVGIGSAPSEYFMRKAAEFGRGSYTYISDTSQLANEMSALFSTLQSPALTDITIDWPTATASTYPAPVPDLYAGEPIVAVAQLPPSAHTGAPIRVKLTGKIGQTPWQQTVKLSLDDARPPTGIAKLWARKRVESLTDSELTGGNPETIKQQIIDTALTHQIVTRYTSLIAVEQTPSRPSNHPLSTSQVPLLKPAGSQMHMPYPATGTHSRLFMLFGLLAISLGCVLRSMR